MMYALQAEGLVKRFGRTTALAGVDLHADQGSVLAVLGPNGAGKTTAIRVLATLVRPDGGTAKVAGLDVVRQAREVRRLIALCGQQTTVDEELTGMGNLVMIGRLLDLRAADAARRATELLGRFDLSDAATRPVAAYSGGMRRRLDLAACLVGHPRVVFLDEPSAGLDPGRREDLWRALRGLVNEGVTVLLTTQYLEEADAMADRVVVIDGGRVIAHGSPAELKRIVGGQTISVRPARTEDVEAVASIMAAVAGRMPERLNRQEVAVPVEGDTAVIGMMQRFHAADIPVAEFSLRLPSLDEAFLALTGGRRGINDNPDRQR
ncbi:MAG: ATP-binding cassette domain-containing protein [Micromonosporaceae bacterium]|nr:ATP-binding cassette domain-containing protein [Micromonosporaceae bacterium]